MSQICGI